MLGRKGAIFGTRLCEKCGKEFTPRSGPQKYCDDCKKIVRKEIGRKHRAVEKERRKNEKCCICGGPFGETINGKPYCWKHRRRYRKYGTFDLPGRTPLSTISVQGGTLKITTPAGKLILADAEDIDKIKGKSWRVTSHGYAATTENGLVVYMHRLIMKDLLREGHEIDHANGNKADNRKCNLRVCQHKENARNLGIQKNNTSGFPGVWENGRGKYRASIMVDYKEIYLGTYPTLEKAVEAREKAEDKYHGKFAGHIRREQSKN